jgi:hypothetical protein
MTTFSERFLITSVKHKNPAHPTLIAVLDTHRGNAEVASIPVGRILTDEELNRWAKRQIRLYLASPNSKGR